MDNLPPSSSPLPDHNRPLFREIVGKPVIALFSAVLFVLLILSLTGKVKIDGWSILLFILAVLPWTLPAVIATFSSFSDVFGKSNIDSIEIGNVKIKQLEYKVKEQDAKIEAQRKVLDDLALYSMAFYIYDKLKYICLGVQPAFASQYGEYRYQPDEASKHDLRYLRDHGYLEHFQIGDLQEGENLVGKLIPTEMGRKFVELKETRFQVAGASLNPSVPKPTASPPANR